MALPDKPAGFRIGYDLKPLGSTMRFLLPSVKLEQRDLMQRSVRERVDDFLRANCSGRSRLVTTVEGWWKDESGRELYGEYREYRVSLEAEADVDRLNAFLAEIAVELGESFVCCVLNNAAYLIFPRSIVQPVAE